MPTRTETARTIDVTLYVIATTNEGWRVRSPDGTGRAVFVSGDYAFRLSPAKVNPARFRLPRWLWARLTEPG